MHTFFDHSLLSRRSEKPRNVRSKNICNTPAWNPFLNANLSMLEFVFGELAPDSLRAAERLFITEAYS